MERPVKAPHKLVEGHRVAAVGATGKVELRSAVVRVRTLTLSIAGLYDRTLLAVYIQYARRRRLFRAPAIRYRPRSRRRRSVSSASGTSASSGNG
jgi:hypothetical protein